MNIGGSKIGEKYNHLKNKIRKILKQNPSQENKMENQDNLGME